MQYLKNEYKKMAFFFIQMVLIYFLLFILCLFFTSKAHAGVVVGVSGKLRIISIDDAKNSSFDLHPLREKLRNGETIKADIQNLARTRTLYRAMNSILDNAFIVDGDDKLKRIVDAGELSEKGGGFAFGEIEVQKIADRIYKQVVSSSSVADIDDINRILYEIIDKARMKQSFRAEAKELERIRKIIHDTKERAEQVLTDAEIQKLLEQAESVLAKAKKETEDILEAAIMRQNFGASIYCESEIIIDEIK